MVNYNNIHIHVFSYVLSFILFYNIFDYGREFTFFVTNTKDTTTKYYDSHYFKTFFYEMILVAIFIIVSHNVIQYYNISDDAEKIITVTLVTIVLSGLCILFSTYFKSYNFFLSKWFINTGWKGIIFELILTAPVYHVYRVIFSKLTNKPSDI